MLALANHLPIGLRRVDIGGAILHVDTIDRWLAAQSWRRGWLEAEERALIRARVRPGMTALDIGANVGVHTCGLAQAVGLADHEVKAVRTAAVLHDIG